MVTTYKPSTMMDPRVIPAKCVTGTDVYSQRGDHLGEIDDVMIDKRSGEVVYAIFSFGGFLGIGEKYHPLPWQVLTYDTDLSGYVVNVNDAELKKAPHYSRDEFSDTDIAWRDTVPVLGLELKHGAPAGPSTPLCLRITATSSDARSVTRARRMHGRPLRCRAADVRRASTSACGSRARAIFETRRVRLFR
jgi:hypothetical protein